MREALLQLDLNNAAQSYLRYTENYRSTDNCLDKDRKLSADIFSPQFISTEIQLKYTEIQFHNFVKNCGFILEHFPILIAITFIYDFHLYIYLQSSSNKTTDKSIINTK